MVRLLRGFKITEVAVDTVVPDAVEAKPGLGSMALPTIGQSMYACQRKTIALVHIHDIVHDPMV